MTERNLREELDKQSAKERIILPLDVATINEALNLVERLRDHVGVFKIGFEFQQRMLQSIWSPNAVPPNDNESSAASNMRMIRLLAKYLDGNVFWDGKFHDIPNTVKGAAAAVADMKFRMFNVHASGDVESMKRAVENAGDVYVLAVTVLTSITPQRCGHIYGLHNEDQVLEFVDLASEAGVHGIICSPQEVGPIRKCHEFDHLALITPGVRPAWAPADDQKRVMTPYEAIVAGADALVIGRPISKAEDPIIACRNIAEEIHQGLVDRKNCAGCGL